MLGKFFPSFLTYKKNAPLRMRTAAYKVGVASDQETCYEYSVEVTEK